MAPGRTVDRADHRHLDFEEPHQEVATLPMDAVDALPAGPGREGRGARSGARTGEFGPGAGEDHDAVVAVGADIVEGLWQFAMRPETPAQRPAIGMQRHQEDAVAPLEAHALVFVGVIVELAHDFPPAATSFVGAVGWAEQRKAHHHCLAEQKMGFALLSPSYVRDASYAFA